MKEHPGDLPQDKAQRLFEHSENAREFAHFRLLRDGKILLIGPRPGQRGNGGFSRDWLDVSKQKNYYLKVLAGENGYILRESAKNAPKLRINASQFKDIQIAINSANSMIGELIYYKFDAILENGESQQIFESNSNKVGLRIVADAIKSHLNDGQGWEDIEKRIERASNPLYLLLALLVALAIVGGVILLIASLFSK